MSCKGSCWVVEFSYCSTTNPTFTPTSIKVTDDQMSHDFSKIGIFSVLCKLEDMVKQHIHTNGSDGFSDQSYGACGLWVLSVPQFPIYWMTKQNVIMASSYSIVYKKNWRKLGYYHQRLRLRQTIMLTICPQETNYM